MPLFNRFPRTNVIPCHVLVTSMGMKMLPLLSLFESQGYPCRVKLFLPVDCHCCPLPWMSGPLRAGQRLIGLFIDGNWLLQGVWFNLLTTLGCVHSMLFGAFHMDFYMARGLSATEVAAVHSFFSLWNPLNDIVAGLLVDEWVARGFGSRLLLAVWANAGYAATTWFAFQELSLPAWVQYALAISLSDGFAAVAGAVNGLILIEQTSEDRQRIQIQRLNSLFGCLEWLVMSGAYWLWDARPGEGQAFRGYLSAVCGGSQVYARLAGFPIALFSRQTIEDIKVLG